MNANNQKQKTRDQKLSIVLYGCTEIDSNIEPRSFFLTYFDQNSVRRPGVKEANQFVVGSLFGLVVEQFKSGAFQAIHFGPDVAYLESDVVHALTFFVDEAADDPIGGHGFQQLDLGFTLLEKRRIHLF